MPVEIAIYEPIGTGGVTARQVKDQLAGAGRQPVVVRIHSPGGSAIESLAVFHLLAAHEPGVNVSIDGYAASGASIIAMAGREISIAETGGIMLHNVRSEVDGDAAELRSVAELLDKVTAQTAAVYASRSKQPAEKIAELMAAETWLDAQEAVALGFANRIVPARKLAASWDAARYFRNPSTLHTKGITVTPASIPELKAACPGATADFILAQAEAGADVAAAKAAWLDAREAELAKREAKAAARPGVQPLAATTLVAPVTDGAEEFAELVDGLVAKGIPRLEAVRRAGRSHRDAHEAFVRAHNRDHQKIQSLIGERFAR